MACATLGSLVQDELTEGRTCPNGRAVRPGLIANTGDKNRSCLQNEDSDPAAMVQSDDTQAKEEAADSRKCKCNTYQCLQDRSSITDDNRVPPLPGQLRATVSRRKTQHEKHAMFTY